MSTADVSDKHSFYPLRVAKVIEETHDAKSFVFEIPEALGPLFRYRAGQFLTLEVPHEGVALKRCYSLASSPQHDREHKVTVKRVASGRASNWLNDRVREGDVLRVQPPDGRFVLTGTERPLMLFAGGSGITPVISLLKTALATTTRGVRLVYANRDAASVIFERELTELVKSYGSRLAITYRQDDREGFVKDLDVPRLIAGIEDGEMYMCGPTAFMDVIERSLLAAGVLGARIHMERFLSLPDPKAEAVKSVEAPVVEAAGGASPAAVSITLAGVTHELPYTPGKSLLRTAIDAGIDAPYSCEEGFCGSCAAQLLEGEVKMDADDALTKEEKKRGLVLACQARPLTKRCAIRFVD